MINKTRKDKKNNNLIIEEYNILDRDTINKKFLEACKNNDIELVKFLLTSEDLPIRANIHYEFETGVNFALSREHFELAKYLLLSDDLSEKVDYQMGLAFLCQVDNLELFKEFFLKRVESASLDINKVFKLACDKNGINIVKYLLTSKELNKNADIDFENSIALECACFQKNTKLIDFLLTGENIRNLDINTNDGIAFQTACKWGRLDTVKYLLNSPKLNKNVVLNNDKVFITACEGYMEKLFPENEAEYFNILKYLIIEGGIIKSNVIKDFLFNNELTLIDEIFNKRDLCNQLAVDLIQRNNTHKIKKI